MKYGPDISKLAAVIGDPARAAMLSALMAGRALTSSELALEAGIGAATASSHLARLQDAGRVRTGPKDVAMRKARVCYDHLAGDYGVRLFSALVEKDVIVEMDSGVSL